MFQKSICRYSWKLWKWEIFLCIFFIFKEKAVPAKNQLKLGSMFNSSLQIFLDIFILAEIFLRLLYFQSFQNPDKDGIMHYFIDKQLF